MWKIQDRIIKFVCDVTGRGRVGIGGAATAPIAGQRNFRREYGDPPPNYKSVIAWWIWWADWAWRFNILAMIARHNPTGLFFPVRLCQDKAYLTKISDLITLRRWITDAGAGGTKYILGNTLHETEYQIDVQIIAPEGGSKIVLLYGSAI